jgi:hypothetical protein
MVRPAGGGGWVTVRIIYSWALRETQVSGLTLFFAPHTWVVNGFVDVEDDFGPVRSDHRCEFATREGTASN